MPKYSVNALFEILITACATQFGFNPKQVSAGMRYLGAAPGGKHLFRDSSTHSQILLKPSTGEAKLVKRSCGESYWDDAELALYQKTDTELATDEQNEATRLKTLRESAFFLRHAEYLRSLFQGHPAYSATNPTPFDGAVALTKAALAAGDPDAATLATALAVSSHEAEKLGSWLLDPIAEEREQAQMQRIRTNPQYPEALEALAEFYALPKDAPVPATKAAEAKLRKLVSDIQLTTKGTVFASMVNYALARDLTPAAA